MFATDGGGEYPILGAFFDGLKWVPACWTIAGAWMGESADDDDLIAEWSDRPEIDWSILPAWARCVAFHPGPYRWLWFKNIPEATGIGWKFGCLSGDIPEEYCPKWSGDWRDSLVVRPEKTSAILGRYLDSQTEGAAQ